MKMQERDECGHEWVTSLLVCRAQQHQKMMAFEEHVCCLDRGHDGPHSCGNCDREWGVLGRTKGDEEED